MPFLRQLLKRGHFEELSFYSGLPSTTPAVQGEVMFGVRTAVPAFQFLDRESGKTCLMYEIRVREGGRRQAGRGAPAAARRRPLVLEHLRRRRRRGAAVRRNDGSQDSPRDGASHGSWPSCCRLYFFTILRVAALAVLEFFIALGDMVAGLVGRQHWRAEWHSICPAVGVSIVMREWLRVMVKLSIEEGRADHSRQLPGLRRAGPPPRPGQRVRPLGAQGHRQRRSATSSRRPDDRTCATTKWSSSPITARSEREIYENEYGTHDSGGREAGVRHGTAGRTRREGPRRLRVGAARRPTSARAACCG